MLANIQGKKKIQSSTDRELGGFGAEDVKYWRWLGAVERLLVTNQTLALDMCSSATTNPDL